MVVTWFLLLWIISVCFPYLLLGHDFANSMGVLTKTFPDNYTLNIIKYKGGVSKVLIGLLINF